MNKYGAVKVKADGYIFDSKAEARRYSILRLMQMAGDIHGLAVHPRWELVVNKLKISRYTADFAYTDSKTGLYVVEDVKSAPTRTRDYVIRKKLMQALHGIKIVEVMG